MITQEDWFDLPVHRKFKTMILQCENGAHRLYSELKEIDGIEKLNEFIITSDPPDLGIRLDYLKFRELFRAALENFQPDLLV